MPQNDNQNLKESTEYVKKITADVLTMQKAFNDMFKNFEKFYGKTEDFSKKIEEAAKKVEKTVQSTGKALDEYNKNIKYAEDSSKANKSKELELQTDYKNAFESQKRLEYSSKRKISSVEANKELIDITKTIGEFEKVIKSGKGTAEDQAELDKMRLEQNVLAKIAGHTTEDGNIDVASITQQQLTSLLSGSGEFGEVLTNLSGFLGNAGGWITTIISVMEGISKIASAISKKVDENVDAATELLSSDAVKKLDSRLYGLLNAATDMNENFVQLATDAVDVVGSSPFLTSKDLIDNIVELGNQGIAFNLEQRALWETMSNKIVSTFSVTNEYLLRMIKLQQSDLTDTYMGVEASITRALNSMFKDTQFLDKAYDSIFGSLTDTLSSVGTDLGTQIAYQIELWLGSLSSLGLSESAATAIATAVNNLLTGDINSMSEQGKKLLAMSASNAGISYADLLVNGVQDGKTLNTLMASMVEILQQIYESSEDNNAVLSAWGDVFGFELADWRAIANLTDNYIKTLTSSSITDYNQAAAQSEIKYISENLVSQRVLTSERIDNLIDNTLFNIGWDIASDQSEYITWELAKKSKELVGSLFGDGSIVTSITNFIADMVEGITILSNIKGAISGLGAAIPTLLEGNTSYTQFMQDKNSAAVFLSEVFNFQQNSGAYLDLTDVNKEILNRSSYYATQNPNSFLSKILGTSLVSTGDNATAAVVNGIELGVNNRRNGSAQDLSQEDEYEYMTAYSMPTEGGWEYVGAQGSKNKYRRLKNTEETATPENTKVSADLNQAQNYNYYTQRSASQVGITNSEDNASHYTYDITDLYTLVTTGNGAKVRLAAIEPGVELVSNVSGNLNIDSGSLDAKISAAVNKAIQ